MKRFFLAAAALMLFSGCSENAASSSSSQPVRSTAVTTTQTSAEPVSSVPDEPERPELEPLYDTSPISQAYLTGDASGLDDKQKAVLEKASQVLSEIVTDDMTDYEKELAVHDWMIRNVTYDKNTLNALAEENEDNQTPYGTLFNGEAICSGYSTTFGMFMDMLGIPNQIVRKPPDAESEHAWNMVELDGHWYFVDVTWDDPTPDEEGRPVKHEYFNVDDGKMQKDHVWEYDKVPAADCFDKSFFAASCTTIGGAGDVGALLDGMIAAGNADATFVVEGEQLLRNDNMTIFPAVHFEEGSIEEGLRAAISEWKEANDDCNVNAKIVVINDEPMVFIKATPKAQKKNKD